MVTKSFPLTIIVSLLVLGLIAFVGIINVSSGLGFWWARGTGPLPVEYIGRAVVFGLVPMLAILDLLRSRSSGRYLALLSLLCACAVLMRLFFDLLLQHPASSSSLMAMPFFSIAFMLAALILSLASSKATDAFFETDENGQKFPIDLPILFSYLRNHILLRSEPALSITQTAFSEADSRRTVLFTGE